MLKQYKRFFFICGLMLSAAFLAVPAMAQAGNSSRDWAYLAGTSQGLYGVNRNGVPAVLRSEGNIRRILRAGSLWVLLTDEGVLVSNDLMLWETRNNGLPVKTIKVFENGEKSFIKTVQEIKDIKIHPENPEIMAAATKDSVFLSRNSGQNWIRLGMPSYRTNGIKAVAVASLPRLTVFLSHSTYGLHYIEPDSQKPAWIEINKGLEKLETTDNPDEISDMAISAAAEKTEIYASQTFRKRIYRLDWETKTFEPIYSDGDSFGAIDSLSIGQTALRFASEGRIMELNKASRTASSRRDILAAIENTAKTTGRDINSFFVMLNQSQPNSEQISLNELWLLGAAAQGTGGQAAARRLRYTLADRKEGLYLPVNHAREPDRLNNYLKLMRERNLNMIVIDMKDDLGRLRFTPNNPLLTQMGRVFWPVDLELLVKTMKERGIYMAARIVVFKDPELAKKEGGKYAVWDGANNKPWLGYYDTRRKKPETETADDGPLVREILPADDPEYEIVRTYYDERWVDPYSEDVWEYTAALARELHERGFDEIQFDYIRFPTDGVNLSNARYRWQNPGMDMESAILSFLRHVRSRLDAPISLDIYGANGWYRTGARTGQEVELLAPYVDVICPMYYPSHFEQHFLANDPAEMRPYRIYYHGVQRTAIIGRGQIIVRPYVQAFFLNVSYDRRYYDLDYVRRERDGVRDAGGHGLTYWNNAGRYDDIPFE